MEEAEMTTGPGPDVAAAASEAAVPPQAAPANEPKTAESTTTTTEASAANDVESACSGVDPDHDARLRADAVAVADACVASGMMLAKPLRLAKTLGWDEGRVLAALSEMTKIGAATLQGKSYHVWTTQAGKIRDHYAHLEKIEMAASERKDGSACAGSRTRTRLANKPPETEDLLAQFRAFVNSKEDAGDILEGDELSAKIDEITLKIEDLVAAWNEEIKRLLCGKKTLYSLPYEKERVHPALSEKGIELSYQLDGGRTYVRIIEWPEPKSAHELDRMVDTAQRFCANQAKNVSWYVDHGSFHSKKSVKDHNHEIR